MTNMWHDTQWAEKADELDEFELLNRIYDTLFENVGMSEHHKAFPLDLVEKQEVGPDGIYFLLKNGKCYRVEITEWHNIFEE